ncbi:MAG: porphobilinogen synthase [Methanomassiliicoccales archaeon]|nr:porphobilinogen synthase [Methanomassiliicoccales archaeon]NYT15580.1 porphobilinogen synthase [Methanomassiliicoccales archaeon]
MFPDVRLRRLRMNPRIRDMVRETRLSVNDLVYPMFFNETIDQPKEILSMPGIFSYPVDQAGDQAKEAEDLGIPAIMLFGIPGKKDDVGSGAWTKDGVIQGAIRRIKAESDILVIADLCLCEYTSHGHCGMVRGGEILNDETLKLYARAALSQVEAGADMIAPSGMMDGMITAIRQALDREGFDNIPLMSYSAKYASAYYGPFRDAAESTPQFGDRRSHQMDPANAREAIREVEMDIAEGADIVMVKPALAYLDVIRDIKQMFNLPVAAYNVSGEYSMIMAASQNGWMDRDRVMMETLTSIKRAGADIILTYFAKDVAERLRD